MRPNLAFTYGGRSLRRVWLKYWQTLRDDSHRLVETLFIRILAVIYLIAFISLQGQLIGLAGAKGVAPAADLMSAMREAWGFSGFWSAPSLFWWGASDRALNWVCVLGVVASPLVFRHCSADLLGLVLYFLSIIGIRYPAVSLVSMGCAPARKRLSRDLYRVTDSRLGIPFPAVSAHVRIGIRQARQWRSHLA